jgi:hypothetical protein
VQGDVLLVLADEAGFAGDLEGWKPMNFTAASRASVFITLRPFVSL